MGGRESGKVRSRGKPGTFDDKTFRSFPKSPLQEAANPAQTGSEIRHGYAGSKIKVRRLHHLLVVLLLLVGQASASAQSFFTQKIEQGVAHLQKDYSVLFGAWWQQIRVGKIMQGWSSRNSKYKATLAGMQQYWDDSNGWFQQQIRFQLDKFNYAERMDPMFHASKSVSKKRRGNVRKRSGSSGSKR